MNIDLKDRQTWLAVGCILLFVVGGGVLAPKYGIKDVWKELQEVKTEADQKNSEVKDMETKVATREETLKRINDVQEKVSFYEKRLPSSVKAPELLSELTRIAHISGLKFMEMKSKDVVQKEGYVEIPLEIKTEVDYHGFGIFLNMIENSDRFSKVDDLLIQKIEDNYYVHSAKLVLSTFMFSSKISEDDDLEYGEVE